MKAKHDALLTEARAISDKAQAEKRAMTDEEVTAFDAKMAEADKLAATIERQAKLAEAEAKLPAVAEVAKAQFSTNERKREPGEWLGTIVRAQATFGANKLDAQKWAERTYGGSSPEYRALGWTDFTAGGALVPEEYSREIIPLLANTAVFRRAGARVLPLRGTLDIPEMTGGVTAYWLGENQDITPSEPTFGRRRLVEKTLAALTPISNDLLRLADPSVDLLLRDNVVQAFANAEDAAFFKGLGTEYTPKGIYYQMTAAHNTATAGTALANFRTDIQDCVTYLDDDNIPRVRRAWFYPTSTVTYMKWTLVDGNSNFSFPELRANNTIDGYPVFVTNNLTTEMYHVEMSYIFIGDGPGLEIKVQDGAAWDNSGTVVAGFSRNQSVIRAIRKTDMIMANANAAACQNTLTV